MEACSNAPKSGTVEFKPLEVPILLLTEGNAFKKHGPKAGTTDFKPLGANSPTY